MNCWRKKLPYSEVSLAWSPGCWSFRDIVAAEQQQAMFLLNFGHIRQHLSDVVDTVWFAVTHRDIDIGSVIFFVFTTMEAPVTIHSVFDRLPSLAPIFVLSSLSLSMPQ